MLLSLSMKMQAESAASVKELDGSTEF
jgi:hypothetical protein